MDDAWPASRQYLFGTVANWGLFLVGVWLLAWNAKYERLPAAADWVLVLVLAASVAVQFVAAYRLVARQDEYIRGIIVKRIVAATGVTITLAVLAGLSEQFLGLTDLPMWVVYPLFWGMFGAVTPFVRDTRP